MTTQPDQLRRMEITVEAVVEVDDAARLERAALADVDDTMFAVDSEAEMDTARREAAEEIRGDLVAAVSWLLDLDSAFDAIPGVTVTGLKTSVGPVDGDTTGAAPKPDFAGLFPVCHCGLNTCQTCAGSQFTPRTAEYLWSIAQVLADQAYDDSHEHGDAAVTDTADWSIFDRYPPSTFGQNAVWRRQAARAFDDLTADIEAGRRPLPTCFAEEMALHLILRDVTALDELLDMPTLVAGLPEHPDDLDWDGLLDALFQDYDILELFTPALDGIDDPDSELNQRQEIGDMRPAAWFTTFGNRTPRDGRRPFRR